ncbi:MULTISPECIES: hypothetical protein [Actinomadura]|uniref:Uncharacterized protein n=1 Tax=Actinomadura litoris TaxID=2678616 RepID=A0A7K1L6E4_9ACTN|nr:MULTISPECIES: hypothetical protein [Actinomadura]MBT2213845.1 hypothetical protein [Actinomadura sp. NEAU-AAG7]MUN39994.1 hypothetical protein [Actinomadura litoris]
MTILSGLLALLAIAMMVTLVGRSVRRDRDLRRNAPGTVAGTVAAPDPALASTSNAVPAAVAGATARPEGGPPPR